MQPTVTTTEAVPGSVQFRDSTYSDDSVAEPDIEVLVTDEVVVVRPMDGVKAETPIGFTIRHDKIRRIRCEGFLCRSIVIESTTGEYEVQTRGLDEVGFRNAVVDHADLNNPHLQLPLDALGICPCKVGIYAGSMLLLIGVGMIFTLVGALLGAGIFTAGLAVIGLTYLARRYNAHRRANVWGRNRKGTEFPV